MNFPPFSSSIGLTDLPGTPQRSQHQCLNSPWICFSFDLVIQRRAPRLAIQNPPGTSSVQRRKGDIEFFSTPDFHLRDLLRTYALKAISRYQRPRLVLGVMNDCQVSWPMWPDRLRCGIFGPSGCGSERVKWPWQPVASFWPSQAPVAPGSGSSAYSPTSRRPHVDKGWGSCRRAFWEIKTWPNFLQSMSVWGGGRGGHSPASFPCFLPLRLHAGSPGAACLSA